MRAGNIRRHVSILPMNPRVETAHPCRVRSSIISSMPASGDGRAPTQAVDLFRHP